MKKKLNKTKKKITETVNIKGVPPPLTSKDKTKKALCVRGKLDGKRIEFDNEKDSFFMPVQGEEIRPGFYAFDEIRYTSSDFKVEGTIFRIFHPKEFTKKDVFISLMTGYIGKAQLKKLKKKFNIPPEEIERAKSKFKIQ